VKGTDASNKTATTGENKEALVYKPQKYEEKTEVPGWKTSARGGG